MTLTPKARVYLGSLRSKVAQKGRAVVSMDKKLADRLGMPGLDLTAQLQGCGMPVTEQPDEDPASLWHLLEELNKSSMMFFDKEQIKGPLPCQAGPWPGGVCRREHGPRGPERGS